MGWLPTMFTTSNAFFNITWRISSIGLEKKIEEKLDKTLFLSKLLKLFFITLR